MKSQKIRVKVHMKAAKPAIKANAIESNKKILERYKQVCKNKGLTHESIKAICDTDIPLFLRFIGEKRIEEVTHLEIEDYLTYCSSKRHNKAQTLARKYTSLNSFFNTIIKKELANIVRNPMNKVDKPKARKKVRPFLTLEEYQTLLDYCDNANDLRGAALISFYFSSACRLTEGWQQNKSSLDMEHRRFKVLGKGEKERTCVFSEDAKSRIEKYLASRTDNYEALFISSVESRWGKRSIQRYLKKLGKQAGLIKNVHPHLFRHTRAMALLRQDVSLDKIQKLLGHESIATTQIYAHTSIDDVQEIIDGLDNVAS